MLGEKFLLVLEMLLKSPRQATYNDGAPRVVSSASHVPMKLPAGS